MEAKMTLTRLFSCQEIQKVARWPLVIDAVGQALITRAAGLAATPVSGQITLPNALLHLKAGALVNPGILSIKANLRRKGEKAVGLVVLFDTDKGEVVAILDSSDITSMRTAALASLAAQTLLSPGPIRVAVIGAGPVAAKTLDALRQNSNITDLRLWSRDPKRAQALASSQPEHTEICDTPAEAVANATLIVTATPSPAPLLTASDLQPGVIILALGADSPGKRELDLSVLANAHIITDQTEDALRVGECAYLPPELHSNIMGEIGDILAGKLAAPRSGRQITVFDSVGSAIIDASVSQAISSSAFARGYGTSFDFAE
jgi:alanine dehydrogenase